MPDVQQNGVAGMQQTGQPAMPVQQPQRVQVQQAPPLRQSAAYLSAINAMVDVASIRVLGLLAMIGALLIFGFAIYDPTNLRSWTAGAYACVVLWPLMILYASKGTPG